MPAGRKPEVVRDHRTAERIREMVRYKVPVKNIVSRIIQEGHQNAPNNLKMLYKVYGDDIRSARAEAVERVGKKVFEQAEEGHFPSQEMYLTTQEDWSKKDKVEFDLANDEDNSAVGAILAMLGVDKGNETKNT